MVTNKVEFKAQQTPPNPKEVDYWINTAEDPNGSVIMYYDGKSWKKLNLNNGESTDSSTSSTDGYSVKVNEDGFFVVDAEGNIGMQYNDDGLSAAKVHRLGEFL